MFAMCNTIAELSSTNVHVRRIIATTAGQNFSLTLAWPENVTGGLVVDICPTEWRKHTAPEWPARLPTYNYSIETVVLSNSSHSTKGRPIARKHAYHAIQWLWRGCGKPTGDVASEMCPKIIGHSAQSPIQMPNKIDDYSLPSGRCISSRIWSAWRACWRRRRRRNVAQKCARSAGTIDEAITSAIRVRGRH